MKKIAGYIILAVIPVAVLVVAIMLLNGNTTGTEDIEGKAMNQNQSSSSTKISIKDFTLTFHSYGGPELSEGLHERQTCLILRGRNLTASLEKHRSESDAENEPIGEFEMVVTEADLEKVYNLVEKVGLKSLPEPIGRQFQTSVFEISVTLGDNSFTRQIVSTDINTLNKTGPLIDELYRLAGELQEHPVTAIRINVNYSPENSNFVVSIVNSGERAALINDPQALPRDEDNWTGVRIAYLPDEIPGVTSPPLEWERVYVEPGKGEKIGLGVIRIDPGEELSRQTEKWKPEKIGVNYLVQGIFSSYEASITPESLTLIRGAVFSEAIEVKPK